MTQPRGLVADLGDAYLQVRLLAKGRRLRPVVHIGAPVQTTAADRVVRPAVAGPAPGRIERMTDIRADKKVALSIARWTDEMGNETAAPDGVSVTWTQNAGSEFATLTDNGDGTAVLASVGPVGGPVLVHLDASAPGMAPIAGDEMFMVVPGDAQRAEIGVGPEEEVTED